MNRTQVAGSAKVANGKVLEAIGNATGNSELASAGRADQVEGQSQEASVRMLAALKAKWHIISLPAPKS